MQLLVGLLIIGVVCQSSLSFSVLEANNSESNISESTIAFRIEQERILINKWKKYVDNYSERLKRNIFSGESGPEDDNRSNDELELHLNTDEAQYSSQGNFKKIGTRYFHIENKERLDWLNAREKCENMGASLVSLHNVEEWSTLKEHLLKNENYWTDIRPEISNIFKPDNLCLELASQYGHFITEVSCFAKNYYVCEISLNLNPDRPPNL